VHESLKAFGAVFALALGVYANPCFAETGNAFFNSALVAASGDRLITGNKYYAPGQKYFVVFQGDGNLVVYRAGFPDVPLWSAASNGGSAAVFQSDGNLVIYRSDMVTPVWASNTGNNPNGWNVAQVRIWSNGQLTVEGAAGLYFQTYPDYQLISANSYFYPGPRCASPGYRVFDTYSISASYANVIFNKTVQLPQPNGSCALN